MNDPTKVRGYIDPMQLAQTANELADQIRTLSGMLASLRNLADDMEKSMPTDGKFWADELRGILDQ